MPHSITHLLGTPIPFLDTIFDYIPRIKNSSLEAMEFFRSGKELEGQKVLTDALDGCQWISEALGLLKSSLVDSSNNSEFEQLWIHQEESYKAMVDELQEAFRKNDLVLLADVLEYELTTCLDNWLELLRKA